MFLDSRNEFSDAQAVSASAASTNLVDLGGDFNVGKGRPLYWVVQVDTALDDADGNETYVADLQTDDNSSFSSATNIAMLTFTRGDAAGTRKYVAVPNENEQYLRTYYNLGGTTPSGAFSAWLTDQEPQSWEALPDALTAIP